MHPNLRCVHGQLFWPVHKQGKRRASFSPTVSVWFLLLLTGFTIMVLSAVRHFELRSSSLYKIRRSRFGIHTIAGSAAISAAAAVICAKISGEWFVSMFSGEQLEAAYKTSIEQGVELYLKCFRFFVNGL